jgi:hypothetical protein
MIFPEVEISTDVITGLDHSRSKNGVAWLAYGDPA